LSAQLFSSPKTVVSLEKIKQYKDAKKQDGEENDECESSNVHGNDDMMGKAFNNLPK